MKLALKTTLPLFLVFSVSALRGAGAQLVYEPHTFTTIAGSSELSVGNTDGSVAAARFNSPYGVAVDPAGNIYVSDWGNKTIRKITPDGAVTTFAGGPSQSGSFVAPAGLAIDGTGNLYVADKLNHTIHKLTPAGVVTTIAGSPGAPGSDNGTGSAARFNGPIGVAVDTAGTVYVTEETNHTIRKITADGVVTTLAGQAGAAAHADGAGSAARFFGPNGIAVDGSGNVFVSESGNFTIRKITPAGVVTTLAGTAACPGCFSSDGTGSEAHFFFPGLLAIDSSGNLYVTEIASVRKITPAGVVTTIAGVLFGSYGNNDGPAAQARFNSPHGLAVDAAGNLYVADGGNNTIRQISGAGIVATIAGLAPSSSFADAAGDNARFRQPTGVAVDGDGNLYLADTNNHALRKISSGGVVTTILRDTDGIARPEGVAVDRDNTIYFADTGTHRILKITVDGTVTTLAGKDPTGFGVSYTIYPGSVDGTGEAARFHDPSGIAVDDAGIVYVADRLNSAIRKITPDGTVTTFAGEVLSPGDTDGAGSVARFNQPYGVAVDEDGRVFVTDTGNKTVRMITTNGVVSTIAGAPGTTDQVDGVGTAAHFIAPTGIAVDRAGALYVTDGVIRRVSSAGVVTTLAGTPSGSGNVDGTGAAARFFHPRGIAVDGDGHIYVANTGTAPGLGVSDQGANTIRVGVPAVATRQANISTRAETRTGANIAIAGFVIHGPAVSTKQVLVRAAGPGLSAFPVSGWIAAPTLSLYDASGELIATNTGWSSPPVAGNSTQPVRLRAATAADFQVAGAFAFATGSADCAMVLALPPGAYTAHVAGVDDSGGITLAEVYELNALDAAVLANISTRAWVGTGAGVVIPGISITGSEPATLLIRAIGPGLVQFQLSDLLAEPALTLFDADGNTIASNTGWGDPPTGGNSPVAATLRAATATDMQNAGAFAIAAGSADCAMVVTLPPGLYTANVGGSGDTTGLAIVEVYRMP